ncbi:hypothetical protein MRB53_032265 [Persea americana]|uniref:Uncharacterized protein n=1 Tax=Persea americana TaxID=3435 RepID=A0ACC2KRU6_PERAE|nr:hypothetical protein MRB53_032265 [Persea americana]
MDHLKPFHSLLFYSFFAFVNLMLSISAELDYLNQGSSIPVERSDNIIVSPDRTFSAGFRSVGDNAYCFAVWFTHVNFTPVWIANRDYPVNGRRSALSLQKDGNVVLRDAARSTIWETGTTSASGVRLRLFNTGNLILQTSTNNTLWQSFNFPTDTLLPNQQFTKDMKLVASRSQGNYSSGFYYFFFDNDNLLRLLYNGPNISSTYWPDPTKVSWEVGRSTYNSSRTAVFDLSGSFQSSDSFILFASDSRIGPKRRLTMDHDGNLRLYSLDEKKGAWKISWQAISNQCSVNGLCGPNSICVYEQSLRRCSCPPGFKLKDPTDLSQGCQPTFNLSCDPLESMFIAVPNTEFFGYDFNYTERLTLQDCMNICLELCSCKAFLYIFDGSGRCFPKTMLLNGYQSLSFWGTMHIKVPRNGTISKGGRVRLETTPMSCNPEAHVELSRTYESKQENNSLKYILWFVVAIGGVELICIVMGWWVRGTRGYMAPEWILNQPITSKVDVYSYGIVLLEAVTGRSSVGFNVDNENNVNNEGRGKGFHNLVAWVRDIMCAADAREGRIQEIMDPMIDHTDDDLVKMELLVMVALNCVEEDRDARPTMRQVVEMLLRDENNS